MQRRDFLKLLAIQAAGGTLAGCKGLAQHHISPEQKEKPNILFIFADDQTFQALHGLGCNEIITPNLDRLVGNGVTFTHAYNQGAWHGAVCVASRTMLNTGRFLWPAQRLEAHLNEEFVAGRFWSQYLKNAGYDTYMTGKWHIKGIHPKKVFDFVTHVRPGMPNQTPDGYDRPAEGKPDIWKPWDRKRGGYWKGGRHWSEVLGDDAIGFLNRASRRRKPFFMYLAFNAPHDPRQSPKEFVDMYPTTNIKVPENFLPEYPYKDAIGCGKDLRDERLAPFPRSKYAVKVHRQEYYAIITHMDHQIGRILDALRRSGKGDNTYVFFTADHGLAVGCHGLMGKQNMFDHSLRVPLIITGPDIARARKINTPVYLQDIMPTTLQLAGVPVPEHIQFKSLLPLMAGRGSHYDYIYGAYRKLQRMVCADGYKFIYYPAIDKTLLFDTRSDPHEIRNLADRDDSAPKLRRLWSLLQKEMQNQADPLHLAEPTG